MQSAQAMSRTAHVPQSMVMVDMSGTLPGPTDTFLRSRLRGRVVETCQCPLLASPDMTAQPLLLDQVTHLADVTFCVVDLETTGAAESSQITEFGAVKVRGGEVLGEFQTLVNPDIHIPAMITDLTGITDSMLRPAPKLPEVLPQFLQFAHGCVLVAHNARFDVGFLKRACDSLGYRWPQPQVVDTVGLARSVLMRDEVPNCRLATLARHFHAETTPNHRALDDARATVDVLHGLLERVGNLGVHTLTDLVEVSRKVSPARRARRTWAASLPEKPGVYAFVLDSLDSDGPRREVLYVGTSRNIKRRVRTYFTASETRSRIDEMVRVATGVEATVCRTPLEASVLELRLIAAHAPRYNRRSKRPHRLTWLKLTQEAFPRFSLVTRLTADGARYFGPFRQRSTAEDALLALYDACLVRRCGDRLSVRRARPACALAELGRCVAPCELGEGAARYGAIVSAVEDVLDGDIRPVLDAARRRLQRLAYEERYEEADQVHRRVSAFEAAALKYVRVGSLARCPEILAAKLTDHGWEIHGVRHGRLVAAAVCRPGDDPWQVADSAMAVAETVPAPVPPAPAATIEETERIADWFESGGVRIMRIEGSWSWPLHSGRRLVGFDVDDVRP